MIDGKNIYFSYDFDGRAIPALRNAGLSVRQGELAAVIGRNGSGKSTLARLFDALLPMQQGELHVGGIDVRGEKDLWKLRRLCGMVFQNPDNQFVSSVVEEDVAFGLENYDVPEEEIPGRVRNALSMTGMDGFEQRALRTLSGGQKQRAALSGVLALEPEVIVFDEATAMLDPDGRREVLSIMERLRRAGKTVVMITHYVEETVSADQILLMDGGAVLKTGTPREILTDRVLLKQAGLLPPVPVRLYYDLRDSGVELPRCPLTNEELAEILCPLN